MQFVVIERFKDRDPASIYARLREQGRTLPEGLRYVDSWVEASFDRCFQSMGYTDVVLLQKWVLQWRDLADFEFVHVVRLRLFKVHFPEATRNTSNEPNRPRTV